MRQQVCAGVTADLTKMLSSLSAAFVKGLNKLFDIGVKLVSSEETEDGGFELHFDIPDKGIKDFTFEFVPTEEDRYDVHYYCKSFDTPIDETDYSVYLKTDKSIQEYVKNIIEGEYGEGSTKGMKNHEDEVKESTRLQAKFTKVMAADGYEIHLTAINCAGSLAEAVEIMDTLMSDESFTADIPENGQAYEINDEGDTLAVEPIAEMDQDNFFIPLLKCVTKLQADMQCVHWNAKGEQFADLHSFADNYNWWTKTCIDVLAEWSVEVFGYAPHPAELLSNDLTLDVNNGFTLEQGFSIIRDDINCLISAIELVYCNMSSDMQSVADEWLRSLKHDTNYAIARRLLK